MLEDEAEKSEKKGGGTVTDLAKKILLTGLGAIFMTEEGIRKSLGDLKVPKDAVSGLLDMMKRQKNEVLSAVATDEAVARALAVAKVYAYASVDYPGAAQSLVFDTDGTTAVGAFVFDPGSATSPTAAFTFAGGSYQALIDPGSTLSVATSINVAGLIVGVYEDLAGVRRGLFDTVASRIDRSA